MSNFWNSIEVDSWARNFSYFDYKTIHNQRSKEGSVGHLLNEKAYKALCQLMDAQMEDDYEEVKPMDEYDKEGNRIW